MKKKRCKRLRHQRRRTKNKERKLKLNTRQLQRQKQSLKLRADGTDCLPRANISKFCRTYFLLFFITASRTTDMKLHNIN